MRILLRDDLRARGHRYSNKHLLTLEKAGIFPRRLRLGGGNRVGWVESEIEAYETALAAARDERKDVA